MPRFTVRLESPDMTRDDGTPHFRVSTIESVDRDTALDVLRRREFRSCAYTLPEDVLATLEEVEANAAELDLKPSATVRGQLHTHRQSHPYEPVSIVEID